MKILVTGGTGFLGSHLVKAFLKEGHQVIILKRSFSNTWRIADVMPHISAYDIDCCEITSPFQDHGRIEAVIHTATCYGRKGEDASEILDVNTAFPLRLLEAAIYFKTDIFFNTDTSLDKFLNPYSLSKKQFAEWGKLMADQRKMRFVNIITDHFYGPGDDDTKFTAYIVKSCIQNVPELKLTAGGQKRDFIYIDSVVSAYAILLRNARLQEPIYQDYEIGSGASVSVREFVETVHRLTGSQTMLKFGALPYREHEVMESHANIEPIKALGWSNTVELLEGLEKTIAVEQKRLKIKRQEQI